jgi:hypothetical protein
MQRIGARLANHGEGGLLGGSSLTRIEGARHCHGPTEKEDQPLIDGISWGVTKNEFVVWLRLWSQSAVVLVRDLQCALEMDPALRRCGRGLDHLCFGDAAEQMGATTVRPLGD